MGDHITAMKARAASARAMHRRTTNRNTRQLRSCFQYFRRKKEERTTRARVPPTATDLGTAETRADAAKTNTGIAGTRINSPPKRMPAANAIAEPTVLTVADPGCGCVKANLDVPVDSTTGTAHDRIYASM